MRLELTKKELSTLMEMATLATKVSEWNFKKVGSPAHTQFFNLEQKILNLAYQNGLDDSIEFDPEDHHLSISSEIEESTYSYDCYEEFRIESFWDELVIRMADRDLIRNIGQNAWDKLTEEERRTQTETIEKHYWDEFTKFGIERLILLHPPHEG